MSYIERGLGSAVGISNIIGGLGGLAKKAIKRVSIPSIPNIPLTSLPSIPSIPKPRIPIEQLSGITSKHPSVLKIRSVTDSVNEVKSRAVTAEQSSGAVLSAMNVQNSIKTMTKQEILNIGKSVAQKSNIDTSLPSPQLSVVKTNVGALG